MQEYTIHMLCLHQNPGPMSQSAPVDNVNHRHYPLMNVCPWSDNTEAFMSSNACLRQGRLACS